MTCTASFGDFHGDHGWDEKDDAYWEWKKTDDLLEVTLGANGGEFLLAGTHRRVTGAAITGMTSIGTTSKG